MPFTDQPHPDAPGPDDTAPLTDEERAVYAWQLDVKGFGEAGQRRLKAARVLVTRAGGLGGVAAYELAAAGVGTIILAQAGDLKPSDLNRQLLQTADWLGEPRAENAARRLRELNPRLNVIAIPENAGPGNAARLVAQADLVIDAAPLFEERYALNAEAVRQRKPMVECAMYELEACVTTIVPGVTPCLACLWPVRPPDWTRRFPVFGAVSGTVGCLGAMEAIKLLAGFGEPLLGRMLTLDLRDMSVRRRRLYRDPHCAVCAGVAGD